MYNQPPLTPELRIVPILTLVFGALASVVLLFLLPEKERFKPDELIVDLLYLAASLYAYIYVAQTASFQIIFGWSLFCVSLMLDVADKLVLFNVIPGGKSLEDMVSFIGIMFFAYGCKQGADQLHQALEKERNVSNHLSELAYTDTLTQLPNRAELLRVIDTWLSIGKPFSVFMVDLNGFKPVNDQYGHSTGDDLLQMVAERLGKQIRSHDFVARHGGDEFIVLQADAGDVAKTTPFARKLQSSFDTPFEIDGHHFALSASIGIAHYPKDGTTSVDLFSHADNAMYLCKQQQSGPQHYHAKPE